jgi:hypothetical protein
MTLIEQSPELWQCVCDYGCVILHKTIGKGSHISIRQDRYCILGVTAVGISRLMY